MDPKIDIRHEHLIDLITELGENKTVLNVGSGSCKIDYHLIKKGYDILSTDYQRNSYFNNIMKDYFDTLNFKILNIFDPSTFPKEKYDVVMCCETLEHLVNYKEAFNNLVSLTKERLIVTVPHKHSFMMPGPPPIGHCNFWADKQSNRYKDINEFAKMADPNKTKIYKIITKPSDKRTNSFCYIIIINMV